MMLLWGLNDHLFKAWCANPLTGKLSDVAGLAVVPLIPVCVYGLLCAARQRPSVHHRTILLTSLITVGGLFAAVNTQPLCSVAYQWAMAVVQWPFRAVVHSLAGQAPPPIAPLGHTLDPTDLLALPALFIPWWVGQRSKYDRGARHCRITL
jgi:hypothetical protein